MFCTPCNCWLITSSVGTVLTTSMVGRTPAGSVLSMVSLDQCGRRQGQACRWIFALPSSTHHLCAHGGAFDVNWPEIGMECATPTSGGGVHLDQYTDHMGGLASREMCRLALNPRPNRYSLNEIKDTLVYWNCFYILQILISIPLGNP